MLLEQFGDRDLTLGDGTLPFRLHFAVVANEGMTGMLAGHQDATGRSANRVAGIVAGETHALCGQLVEAGRLDLLLSVASELGVTKIVGHDVYDVRLPRQ